MNILINILASIICLAIGYLFGSIPTSVLIGKIFFHQDPRDFGSKNPGATNSGRMWGKKAGVIVMLLDMLKAIAAIYLCWALVTYIPFTINGVTRPLCADTMTYYTDKVSIYIIQWPVYWMTFLGSILGHCWPIFSSFKGGKGSSCFMGTLIGTTWFLGFIPATIYLIVLKRHKFVSLSAIVGGCTSTIVAWGWFILVATSFIPKELAWLPMYGKSLNAEWVFAVVTTISNLIVIWRHKGNIERLRAGNERKIKWM